MAQITIDIDLPPELTVTAYQRYGTGHGFEVSWPLPSHSRCDLCHREEPTASERKTTVQVVRDLDILGQPSFWIYQPAYHRCPWCHHRQVLVPPFKRKDVSYTYRFERHVLRLMIGSTEEDVARRLGISAEMVHLIVRNQLTDAKDKQVDPNRKITDLGIDELSHKKGQKGYCTILTDLTDPAQPEVLAVEEGRDESAARKCLEKLSLQQRQQVRSFRADMSQAFHTACRALLSKAKAVVDRFHVAKKFNEGIDQQRKKITQAYKAKLSAAEREEFRSLLWEFRRNPNELTAEQKEQLEELFGRIPRLRLLYGFKVRFQEIFDTTSDRHRALAALQRLFDEMSREFPELDSFKGSFENWQEEILNYFDGGKTSGPVEGINNKARVIIKRAYGLKWADSLWTRLILDLNRAQEVVLYGIDQIQELVAGLKLRFSPGT